MRGIIMRQLEIDLLGNLRRRGGVTFAHVSPQYREMLWSWAKRSPPLVTIADNHVSITAAGIALIERSPKR